MAGWKGFAMNTQVEILQNCYAFPDGCNGVHYKKGDILAVSKDFCKILIDAGYAWELGLIETVEPEMVPEPKRKYARRTT